MVALKNVQKVVVVIADVFVLLCVLVNVVLIVRQQLLYIAVTSMQMIAQ